MSTITKEQAEIVVKKLLTELPKFSMFIRDDNNNWIIGGGIQIGIENGIPIYQPLTHFLICEGAEEVSAVVIKNGEEIRWFPGLYDAADYIIERIKNQ